MSFLNKFLALFVIVPCGVFASQPIERDSEEFQPKVFPAALHEIDALCGPNIEGLTLSKRQEVSDERKELHNLVVSFVGKYIWQAKEQLLYKLPREKEELYKGVRMDVSYQEAAGKSIVAIHNDLHPAFITRGGGSVIDYWNEFFRQKNLCFVNDLWAHLLPDEKVTPTRDFYIAMQRLALALSKEEALNFVSKRTPDKLETILIEMVKINSVILNSTEFGKKQKVVEKASERLYSWATTYLSKSG